MVVPLNIDATPFQSMMGLLSKSLTYIPVTKTVDNINGQETLTDGTSVTIQGNLFFKKAQYAQQQYGLIFNGDGILMVLPSQTLNRDDKVVFDGITYRVDQVTTRYLGGTAFYKLADVFVTDS